MKLGTLLTACSLWTTIDAWLPGEHKHIYSRDGLNLFDRRSLHAAGHLTKRFLPGNYGNDRQKIRGVNLGSLFVLENWLADDVMSGWQCTTTSEFDCVSSLDKQATANSDFAGHWSSWVSAADFSQMVSWGLNTVRIPIGYWMYEAIVDPSEHFPQGGITYLDQIVGYAKAAGVYVILDLHGAPGAQVTDADTGQYNPSPGFYSDYNYNRSVVFFDWLVHRIHTTPAYSTVGMVLLVNEPERLGDSRYQNTQSNSDSMRQTYYPTAWSSIRATESSLGITGNNQLHIQMMDQHWGSGDPKQYLPDLTFAAYDDHQYVKYVTNLAATPAAYLAYSCSDDRSGNYPVIVGEWSLSVATSVQWTADFDPARNVAWYKQWWAAQVLAYEKSGVAGWVFWTWKTTGSLNDPRWDYQKAVALGIVSTHPDDAYSLNPCGGSGGVSARTSQSAARRVEGGSRWHRRERRRSTV